MPIYEFGASSISRLSEVTFNSAGLHERRDLQRLLRENIEVIAEDTLVIDEEFGDWEDSRRRIDLLAIDKNGNLVVIELKRSEDGGHMELQSIRYASMVSTMTFDQAVDIYGHYLKKIGKDIQEPREAILEFLELDEPDEDHFAQDVRIVLASAEFSKELISSVLWLTDHGIDIRCVRLKPYNLEGRTLVDVQRIVPLPEAEDYQFRFREKVQKERQARASNIDFTRFDIRVGEEEHKAMWKRNAIFYICRVLCDKGINPDDITALFDWRPNRVWFSVEGVLDSAQFNKQALERASSGGPSFNPRRWFCDEGELVHSKGKTYAFSNQWGGTGWHKAMNLLKDKYDQYKIIFTPVS
jgi:hypothetical protein